MSSYALQMHSVRDRSEPLTGLLREAAVAGFDGVEFAHRFQQADPRQIRAALDGTGLTPVAVHVDLETILDERDDLLERCDTIGCERLVIPHLPIERFRTREHLRALQNELALLADELGDTSLLIHTTRELLLPFLPGYSIGPIMGRDGLPRGIYNHVAWGASKARRRTQTALREHTPLGILAAEVPHIGFEIDAKSVRTAGFDLAAVLDTFGHRTPLVHLSDVRRSRWMPPDYRPVMPGDGVVELKSFEAMTKHIEWVVAEHDEPDDPDTVIERLADHLGLERREPSLATIAHPR